jgi:uncharacterized phage-associated protein
MDNLKTKQLLTYIAQKHTNATVTVLMKISYLIDLVSVKRFGKPISEFTYRRYTYGPFDQTIYSLLSELEGEEIIKGKSDYTFANEEYIVYAFNEDKKEEFKFDKLTEDDIKIADEVLEQLKGYGAKTLTEITYKTPPMKKLGVTLGGDEHLNEVLDLSCD